MSRASGWNSRYWVRLGESCHPVTHRIRIVKLILPRTSTAYRRVVILIPDGERMSNTALTELNEETADQPDSKLKMKSTFTSYNEVRIKLLDLLVHASKMHTGILDLLKNTGFIHFQKKNKC